MDTIIPVLEKRKAYAIKLKFGAYEYVEKSVI